MWYNKNVRKKRGDAMARLIRHVKTNVRFQVLKEEKKYYIVIKDEEPEIKLRLEKFAVDGKMFKLEKQAKNKPSKKA